MYKKAHGEVWITGKSIEKKVSIGDIPSPLRDDLHQFQSNDLLSIFPALGFVYLPVSVLRSS